MNFVMPTIIGLLLAIFLVGILPPRTWNRYLASILYVLFAMAFVRLFIISMPLELGYIFFYITMIWVPLVLSVLFFFNKLQPREYKHEKTS